MIKDLNNSFSQKIKCAVCNADIKDLNSSYQSAKFHGIVCKNCMLQFPHNDIELMMHLFFIYGGHFGKMRRTTFYLERAIVSLTKELKNTGGFDVEELNQRLVHKALLHGVAPKDLNSKLESLLDD